MLQKYAPRLLVRHLTGRSDAGDPCCTRFESVVLFVDIVDSTLLTDEFARSGSDGAERLAVLLNEYFGRVIAIGELYGGDTFKIDGDAVVILWYAQDGNGGTPPIIGAATAALAIKREFLDDGASTAAVVRHRITLVAGTISFIVFSEAEGRGYAVVDGAPIRELGDPRLRGAPNQIVVSQEAHALLQAVATLAPLASDRYELVGLREGSEAKVRDCGAQPGPNGGSVLETRIRRFVPRVIVDRTDAGQSEWMTEFRRLTPIYINLPGLDPGAPNIAPRVEEAVRRIAQVVNPLGIPISNIVANEKGFVVQIACGLPPFAQERSAALAVQAALQIRHALTAMGLPPAIGITTGNAFCGDVGSSQRREYLSTGLVMAYAARLMQMAGGEIVCDHVTAQAAMGCADFSTAVPVRFKGRAEPLLVRRIRELARPRFAFPAYGAPLFGRAAELQLLHKRLLGLAEQRGGIVAIESEPGGGKTHLLAHATLAAHRFGYFTAIAATSQIEQTTAYFALRSLLPDLVRHDADPPDLALDVVRDRLTALVLDPGLAQRLALLEDILPLEFADEGFTREIKGQARLRGIEDLFIFIAGERARGAPLVLILDDLQWVDASSAHVLSSLLRHAGRTMAIVTTRPIDESIPSHAAALLATASPLLRLRRLPAEAIAAIVKERLGLIEAPDALTDFIATRSEGLPFFAEQLLFALRDHGALVIQDGRCSLGTGLNEMAAPDSLRELIVSRIDRLPPDRQLMIKVASVIGLIFDADTMHELHPLKDERELLDKALEQLTDAGLLNRSSELGRAVYAFRHAIIQGVTYDLLPYAQRRTLHRSAALHLESKYEGALAPHFATLADHWERADEPDRAIPFRIEAAGFAAQRYANDDALNHLDRVERLVAHFSVHIAPRDLARCTRIRADACQELTRFSEANSHYRTLAVLENIAMSGTRAQMVIGTVRESVSQALRRAGLMRTVSRGDDQARDGLAAHIYMRFAEHSYFANDTLGLAYGTLASLNFAERANALPEIVNASGGLALGLSALGLVRWANYYRDRSIELATNAGSRSAQGFAELLACVQSFHIGDWNGMELHGTRGACIWKELGDRYRHQCCLVLEAYRMMATGQYDRADCALSAFGAHAEEIESVQVRAWALAAAALLDLVLGRPPALAIERLSKATVGDNLNPAECLLCDGIAAAAHLEAGDYLSALRAAEAGLANITRGSPAMAGALLFSVPSIAEVLLVLTEHAEDVGRSHGDLLALSRTACKAVQRFAARNRICRPRAALLRGHLAAARGRSRRQQNHYSVALADAESLGLPLEQAMSHLALAKISGLSAARDAHRHEAGKILQRLGVAWAPWRRLRY